MKNVMCVYQSDAAEKQFSAICLPFWPSSSSTIYGVESDNSVGASLWTEFSNSTASFLSLNSFLLGNVLNVNHMLGLTSQFKNY